jgi:DNA-binding response OmpR family regulator
LSPRLLLVDDDALLRRSLAFNLEQAGYRVSAAGNAEDALAIASREPPEQSPRRQEPAPVSVGDLTVDPVAHTVTVGGQPVDLPPREFDLLYALALQPGRVISVDELVTRLWGPEYEGESQVVYVHVRWLRAKLERNPNSPQRIVTVRGVGYKLEPKGA